MVVAKDAGLLLALWVVLQDALQYLDALIGCAVVYEDDVKIPVRLFEDGSCAAFDIFLHAVYRHENAYFV